MSKPQQSCNLTVEECFLQAELLLAEAEDLRLARPFGHFNRYKKIIARTQEALAYMAIASTLIRCDGG